MLYMTTDEVLTIIREWREHDHAWMNKIEAKIDKLASFEDLDATNKRMDWWVNLSAVTLLGFVASLMKALYDFMHPPK